MRRWVGAIGLMAAALAVGCASVTLPPARPMQSGDLQLMGGMWAWTARLQSPATLGAGKPLLPRRFGASQLELVDVARRGQFAQLVYRWRR